MKKNLFRLCYWAHKEDSYFNLDKNENLVTHVELNGIGMKVEEPKPCFIIKKIENEGVLSWSIKNLLDKEIFVNVIKNQTSSSEKLLLNGESYQFHNLLNEKIYFNKTHIGCDFLCFNKTQVQVPKEKKEEDEPMNINFDELGDLFEFLEEPAGRLNLNSVDEEEKQRSAIFSNGLDELLKEYDEIDTFKVEAKIIIKTKIITDDDETDSVNIADKANTNINTINLSNAFYKTPHKSKQEDEDDFLTDSMLHNLLEHYNNNDNSIPYLKLNTPLRSDKENVCSNINCSNMNIINLNNINPIYPTQKMHNGFTSIKKRREEFRKSVSKFGVDFNSNGKRSMQSKELDSNDLISAFKSKRLKKATDNRELQIDSNTTCAICLDSIRQLANLNNCTHDFCKPCILEWSRNTNLCPLCKKEFKKIIYYEKNKKKELKVKKRKLQVEEEYELVDEYTEESSDNCMVCGGGEDFAHMLVCDGCHYNVCHTYCDGLSVIPDIDWFCRDCKARANNLRRVRGNVDLTHEEEEDEEEDGEYSPQIYVEESEKSEHSLMSESYDELVRRIEQGVRPNAGRSNFSLNISVNVNMRRRRGRGRENTAGSSLISRRGGRSRSNNP